MRKERRAEKMWILYLGKSIQIPLAITPDWFKEHNMSNHAHSLNFSQRSKWAIIKQAQTKKGIFTKNESKIPGVHLFSFPADLTMSLLFPFPVDQCKFRTGD